MLIISCPLCGPRSESEFAFGGPKASLPKLDGYTDAKDWHQAVHLSNNLRGQHAELWYHTSGCESWLVVMRDTTTHEITDARQAGIAEVEK